MKKIWLAAAGAVLLCGAAAPSPKLPDATKFLFWTPAEQALGYKNIEKIFPTRVIKCGGAVRELPVTGKPFDVSYSFQGKMWNTDAFMKAASTSGLLIIKDGKIVLERYGLGRKANERWTSFSVAKSITSTLVGAAIKDGTIKSLDSNITDYLPELKKTAYDGVTVRDLITMRSGVAWNEDYTDPKSDVNNFAFQPKPKDGGNPVVAFMAKHPRAHKPGTIFHYDTGETDLAGILVARATHMPLSDYLSKAMWSKIGMEQDGVWMLDQAGVELGGCCISMTLRDYARFGLFFMEGGKGVLPDGWVKAASSKQIQSDFMNLGYGYFWWIHDDETYEAVGIFGQSILVDPKAHLVIVTNSAWPEADATPRYAVHDAYIAAVRKALR